MTLKLGKVEIRREIPTLENTAITYFLPLQAQGPTTWKNLRVGKYGVHPQTSEASRQQTFPEAARLATFAFTNKDNPAYSPIIKAVNNHFLTGDTLTLWTPQGFYANDFPNDELVSQLGVDNQQTLSQLEQKLREQLKGRIGEHVKISANGFVRYAPSNAITFGEQDNGVFAINPGVIVVAGSLENAKGIAESSKQYSLKPFFRRPQNLNGMTVRVPGLGGDSFGGRLIVLGNGWFVYGDWCSFGGTDAAEGSAPKK